VFVDQKLCGWLAPTELRHGASVLAAVKIADFYGYELAHWSDGGSGCKAGLWFDNRTGLPLEPQPDFVAPLLLLPDEVGS
jgi:hypothetical protein